MPMFIEIFLMLCIIAQRQVYAPQPPQSTKENILVESTTVGHKPTIFSLINDAGNCTNYKGLKSELKFGQLEEFCERPFPGTPHANEFVSYETVLCVVLYDAVQRVCKVGHQDVTNDTQNFSGFSCDTMIKGFPEAFDGNIKQWVTLFKAKLGNISDCEQMCVQNEIINPVCEYIWKTISLTYKAPVSSATGADVSPTENLQVISKGHRKTNEIMTSEDKPSEAKGFDQSSAAGSSPSIQSSGSQNTDQVDHKMTPTIESAVRKQVDLAEANGKSTQSGSASDVKKNVEQAHTKNSNVQNGFKKQAQASVNAGHNDAKNQTHTTYSNTQNDTNKQAHGTNSNVQNITIKQEPAINSSNHSAEVTSYSAPVSSSVSTERTPEASKHNDSTGKSISFDSKSNTAPQPENKNPPGVDASDLELEKNDGNEESVTPTDKNTDGVQDTYGAGDDGDQEEDEINPEHQGEQHEQISHPAETQQDGGELDHTAPFNQLGDAADSHFYAYFMTMVVICIIGYLVFHNKQKILALALEGRSRRGTRRRPNTSAYRKLDSNLEEAVTSTGSTSVTHVIY